ncbi:lipopolysaccharide biosynthesis protein [Nocardioides jiangxiensis]|uniref:Membrane protein involved in the export of O-antigen and teichoic acid n=1 Tax=Nocardioides jiangxiensis TaxID=3064524 RepID=A0ABT9B2L4_9ACTN|nr:hypothetical protein [Nocardioides sp. WY-20]MDO7867857.1 hypothetical protein [Nocardioides sp. WY-20]
MLARLRGRSLGEILSLVAAAVGAQLLTVVSAPLLARMLGPEERGHLAIVMMATILVGQFCLGGVIPTIAAFTASAGGPARDVMRGRGRAWVSLSVLGAVLAVGVVALQARGSDHYVLLLAATVLMTTWGFWQAILGAMLRGEGRVRDVNVFGLLGVATYVFMVVLLFVVHPMRSAALVLLVVVPVRGLSLLYGWRKLRRPTGDPALRADPAETRAFARRSYVSGINGLNLGLDVLIVGFVLGAVQVGYYATAVTVTNVAALALANVAGMLLPRLTAVSGAARAARLRRWLLVSAALDLLITLGLEAVISPVMRILMGPEFIPAIPPARLMILAWGLLAFRLVLTAGVQARGHAGTASSIELLCAVLLVPAVGGGALLADLEGAVVGLAAVGALSCVLLALLLRRPERPVSVPTVTPPVDPDLTAPSEEDTHAAP